MRLPEGMTREVWEAVGRLTSDQRDRVLERSAIIHEATGLPWVECDRQALEEERAQLRLRWGT